jgi:hypothetical protein
MPRYWLALIAALSLLATAAGPALAQPETLTDASVVGLVRAGLSAEAIVAKIRISDPDFDLSTDQLIALKHAGVPDPVIAAMLQASSGDAGLPDSTSPDPDAPHAPGAYLLQSGPARMQSLDAVTPSDMRVSDVFASIFTSGIVPMKQTMVLQGPTARVSTDAARPVFYFYFDQASQGGGATPFASVWRPEQIASPSDLELRQFAVNRGNREQVTELRLAPPHVAIGFSSEALATGVFRVTPSADLPPGEYGFVYTLHHEDGDDTRVFDFSVSGP